MADRYNLTYSGEQVNTAIGRGLTSLQPTTQTLSDIQKQIARTNIGAMGALNVYNPNLLINGDFAINQRGESSYTGVAAQYTVDRWIKRSSNDTVAILTKGVRFTHGGSVFCWLNQTLEPTINSQLLGKTLTLSIKVNAVSLSAGASCRIALGNGTTAIISGGFDFGGATFAAEGTYSGLVSIPSSLTNAYLNVIIQINNGTSGDYIDIENAKLELGSIATPFVPPLIAEELLKCQRYYWKLNSASSFANIASGFFRDTTQFRALFYTPTEMRTSPTVAINGTLIILNASLISTTGYTLLSYQGNVVVIQIVASSAQTAGTYAVVSLDNGSVTFDAEIY